MMIAKGGFSILPSSVQATDSDYDSDSILILTLILTGKKKSSAECELGLFWRE